MSIEPVKKHRPGPGSVVVSLLLIAFALLVLWDTTTYVDMDSAVFPRTFAIVLIVASLAYIVAWLIGKVEREEPPQPGSWPRRILLVVVMLVGTLAMPLLGFVLAAIPVFGVLLLVAMHERWTPIRMIVFPLVGLGVVFGFYYLFQELLLVPLPTARLF